MLRREHSFLCRRLVGVIPNKVIVSRRFFYYLFNRYCEAGSNKNFYFMKIFTRMQLRTAMIFTFLLIFNFQLKAQYYPDDEFDTTGMVVETNSDGLDTVWYYGNEEADTTYQDELRLGLNDSTININLGSTMKTVSKGLYGFNTAGIFSRKQMPNDGSALDQWQWMSDLRPETLRFPGGADSKFTDPLTGPGYGYNIEKIAKFYDVTDSVTDNPTLADVIDDADEEDSLKTWIDPGYVEDYVKFYEKWVEQNLLSPGHRYIDDFIALIQKIETDNPGHTVKVILCLNIFSNTATEAREIVEYLRDNPIHDVTVAYVEMGNEPYFDYSRLMMGWYVFEDYWEYINGINNDSLDIYVVGDSVWNDHDFIGTFKSQVLFTCKVAIPAENLHDPYYALREAGVNKPWRADEDWNIDLRAKYHIKEPIIGLNKSRYAFDAVILHPYYDGHNWDSIPLELLDTTYSCLDGDANPYNDLWLFNNYDARLEDAFDDIGINFRNFIRTRYIESYDEHNSVLEFDLDSLSKKDMITSEWNFKDQGNYTDEEVNRIGVYSHGFMHGFITFEWFLKNIKLNHNANYRTGFHTYSTFHNYAGGATNAMIYPAREHELAFLGKDTFPYDEPMSDTTFRNYLMKRTTHFAFELLGEITKQNLKYLQSNFSIYVASVNVQPTVFIDTSKTNLYFYYSNQRDTSQQIIVNTAGTTGIYPGGVLTIPDTATIYCVDALRPYSTSGQGNNTLYKLNECYLAPDNYEFPIEIIQVDTIQNTASCPGSGDLLKCFVVPANSFGYIKVPIEPYYPPRLEGLPLYDVNIYPNPANTVITLQAKCIDAGCELSEHMNAEVYNMQGNRCLQAEILNNGLVNISVLPAGVYQVLIKFEDGNSIVKNLVKQ